MKTLCFCLSPKEDALATSEAARFARLCQKLTALGVAFALLRNEEDYPPAAKKLIEERGEDLLPLALFDGAPAAVGRIPTSEYICNEITDDRYVWIPYTTVLRQDA